MASIVFYMDGRGSAPVLNWLRSLNKKAQINCTAKIERLEEHGHQLERPDCAYLGNKIYELRIAAARSQYRILYFFHEREAVVLSHSFLKKSQKVPKREIQTALRRKKNFETSPAEHTYRGRLHE